MSVMNGFYIELTTHIIGSNCDISVTSKNKIILDQQKILTYISSYNFVTNVSPIISGKALALGVKNNS